jgi:3-methyladenine DNA glycosylase AlkD
MQAEDVLRALDALASGDVRESMRRFGLKVDNAKGISTPALKALARRIGRDHELAARLWESGIFEARVVAAFIDEPAKVTRQQMERWARALDSWGICDACCCYLFRKTPFARAKAIAWTRARGEFHKRAAFSLMAYLAVHDKAAADESFHEFLELVERESNDHRPFVRKAVNWALRQIGKRSPELNRRAIQTAEAIRARGTPTARWIAADALRELRSEPVQRRLKRAGPQRA